MPRNDKATKRSSPIADADADSHNRAFIEQCRIDLTYDRAGVTRTLDENIVLPAAVGLNMTVSNHTRLVDWPGRCGDDQVCQGRGSNMPAIEPDIISTIVM